MTFTAPVFTDLFNTVLSASARTYPDRTNIGENRVKFHLGP